MLFNYYGADKEVEEEYLKNIEKNRKKLSKENNQFLEDIIQDMDRQKDDNSLIVNWRTKEAELGTLHMEDIFPKFMHPTLEILFGKELVPFFLRAVERLIQYSCTAGYYRRPIRSSNLGSHLERIRSLMLNFATYHAFHVSLMDFLTQKRPDCLNYVSYSDWLAIAIDNGDTEIIQFVKELITGDNSAGKLGYQVFQGIFKSHNKELYELTGKLLLVAKLQEGLRQAICETMDSGTIESFLYMFDVVDQNDLIRFSSVKRAVATWTGLAENFGDRLTKKEMAIIRTAITDVKERNKLLKSKDNVELYLGLWATGFYDERLAIDYVKEILKKGERHQRLVTSYYIRHLQLDSLEHQVAKEVMLQYPDQLDLVACYFYQYMKGASVYSFTQENSILLTDYFNDEDEARQQFNALKNILRGIKKKSAVFDPCIFPWYRVELKKTEIAEKMGLMAYLTGSDLVDEMLDYMKVLDTWKRAAMVRLLLKNPVTPKQHDAVITLLADRSEMTRKAAYEIAATMKLTEGDYQKLEKMLRYKAGDLRTNVLSLLANQPDKDILETLTRLLGDKKVEKRLGGLDLMMTMMNDSKHDKTFQKSLSLLTEIKSPTSKEMVLIRQLETADQQADNNLENGFGLYNPDYVPEISSFETTSKTGLKNDLTQKQIFNLSDEELFNIFKELSDFYDQHSHLEYKYYYSNEIVTLNQGFWQVKESDMRTGPHTIEIYPFKELWKGFYHDKIKDFKILYQLYTASTIGGQYSEDFRSKISELIGRNFFKLNKQVKELPYYNQINQVISVLYYTYIDKQYTFQSAKTMALDFINQFDLEEMKIKIYYNQDSEIVYATILSTDWFNFVKRGLKNYTDDEEFKESFFILHTIYRLFRFNDPNESYQYDIFLMDLVSFARAVTLVLIEKDEFYKEIFERGHLKEHLGLISDFMISNFRGIKEGEEKADYVEYIRQQGKIVIDKVLEIELNRGDSPTFFSKAIYSLERIEGIGNLVKILMALGKETLLRSGNYRYYWNQDDTKKSVLSHLLRICYPSPEDSAQYLKQALEGTDITEVRLIETAMYASQWIPIIEEYLGWEGMASGCYYFQAHMSDVDKQKEALFAKYTSIAIEDLALGAFDIDWFKSAYNELGEDRFKLLYDAAKYISNGAKHSRARKFADAVNGKLKETDTGKTIKEKRNKNMVMSYGLIPLGKNKTEDLLKRYRFLQQFLKESKKFGAQRQASEKKAVEIAMENLARNAGYDDVTRLIWQMETELIKEMEKYFQPASVGDITLQIQINDLGKSKIICKKGEKTLKSVPRKWGKDKTVLEMKEAHKTLKEQYSRSRLMLEHAMEDGVIFYHQEISNLMKNPVIAPLLQVVVMMHEQDLGYFEKNGLITVNGEKIKLAEDAPLKIAHPLDLYRSGQWESYQQDLFTRQIKQPFKQVFRELYLKTEDEKGQLKSLRYAGHQIQPKKTVAVLKGRRWVADYEDGLQKVYYKQNIIAKIYAMADWFSPADIEAPTLEWVEFSDRKTFKPIPIDEIPDIIFSEVMRDVDLAVSVAHVGGVDPEASHSTIEMRKAIATFNAQLFRFQNVTFTDHHIFISGNMGSYTIHLGSGVIHQKAGSQIAVLPVHSQHRGRIFLPFVDDDPKTAEIVSKMILFSEDDKIKDPFILEQIKKQEVIS